MYAEAKVCFDRHEWDLERNFFHNALRVDASLTTHHAALRAVEMVLEHWEEAEAEYTAASLIDVDSHACRAQIKATLRPRG
jgi:hypothetical protein